MALTHSKKIYWACLKKEHRAGYNRQYQSESSVDRIASESTTVLSLLAVSTYGRLFPFAVDTCLIAKPSHAAHYPNGFETKLVERTISFGAELGRLALIKSSLSY